jgi:hypothetical protein
LRFAAAEFFDRYRKRFTRAINRAIEKQLTRHRVAGGNLADPGGHNQCC